MWIIKNPQAKITIHESDNPNPQSNTTKLELLSPVIQ